MILEVVANIILNWRYDVKTFWTIVADILKEVMESKGYVVFEGDNYDLNLVGIRSADMQSNRFNDAIGAFYRSDNEWVCALFPGTTDPGLYYRENPMNVRGTGLLAPGQYRGVYELGEHKGHPAFVQKGPFLVYRDANRDANLDVDPDTLEEGYQAMNLHRASSFGASHLVDRWSAGCQVVADPIHHDFLIELGREARQVHGNSFTYTLLEEKDFLA